MRTRLRTHPRAQIPPHPIPRQPAKAAARSQPEAQQPKAPAPSQPQPQPQPHPQPQSQLSTQPRVPPPLEAPAQTWTPARSPSQARHPRPVRHPARTNCPSRSAKTRRSPRPLLNLPDHRTIGRLPPAVRCGLTAGSYRRAQRLPTYNASREGNDSRQPPAPTSQTAEQARAATRSPLPPRPLPPRLPPNQRRPQIPDIPNHMRARRPYRLPGNQRSSRRPRKTVLDGPPPLPFAVPHVQHDGKHRRERHQYQRRPEQEARREQRNPQPPDPPPEVTKHRAPNACPRAPHPSLTATFIPIHPMGHPGDVPPTAPLPIPPHTRRHYAPSRY